MNEQDREIIERLRESPNYLIGVVEGLEELRRGNKDDIRQSQIHAHELLNTTVSSLNKYFFTIASLLVPLLISLVTVNDVRQRIDAKSSVLIAISLISLTASVVIGVGHIVSDYHFLKGWYKEESKKLKLWSKSFWPGVPIPSKIEGYIEEYNSTLEQVDKVTAAMDHQSTNIYIIGQGTFLFIGIFLIAIIVFRLLP